MSRCGAQRAGEVAARPLHSRPELLHTNRTRAGARMTSISEQAKAELARLRKQRGGVRPLAQRRRDAEAEARLAILPRDARFSAVPVGQMSVEWMEMPRVWRDRVLLYVHGGNFVFGSPRTHRRLVAHLSRALHMRVLQPDYRLAPEYPFPAAAQDVLATYKWLLGQGFSADNIVFGGDGAGAGLVLTALVALRDAGAALPRAAMLLSPWVDLACAGPHASTLERLDPVHSRASLLADAALVAAQRDLTLPLLSPLYAALEGLPPLLMQVGSEEVLRDDATRLKERAEAAGVTVSLSICDGLWHLFQMAGIDVPEARQAIDDIGKQVRDLFRPNPAARAEAREPEAITFL